MVKRVEISFLSQKLGIISYIAKMNITLEYQNKKKKETNGSNNNLVQENRNRKQIGWLTLNDITCQSYHINLCLKSVLGASIKHRIDRLKISTY